MKKLVLVILSVKKRKMITNHSKLQTILMRVLLSVSILVISISQVHAITDPKTALDEYVNTADDAYGFKYFNTIPEDGYALHIYSMISQEWRKPEEVNKL